MRVRLTILGIEQGMQGHAKTIYGDGKMCPIAKDYIRVRKDGQKNWTIYSKNFWKEVPKWK